MMTNTRVIPFQPLEGPLEQAGFFFRYGPDFELNLTFQPTSREESDDPPKQIGCTGLWLLKLSTV